MTKRVEKEVFGNDTYDTTVNAGHRHQAFINPRNGSGTTSFVHGHMHSIVKGVVLIANNHSHKITRKL